MSEKTSARRKRIFARMDIEGKRVTGPAPKRVTAASRSYAIFTRILVGYSAVEIIFVPQVAEALEAIPPSLVRARAVAREKAASRQAPTGLQECSARRDSLDFLDQQILRQ